MRAIAITPGQAGTARIVNLPRPVAPPGGALVHVLEVGIDGTDLELHAGHMGRAPDGADFLVIGHESLGVVEAVGPGVEMLNQGDLVVAMVRRPDDCPECRHGSSDVCMTGAYTERGIFGAHGFLTDQYAELEPYLVKVPPGLRETGVLLEPVSVAAKALRHAWDIQRRLRWAPQSALVLGAGSLGLLAALLLRLRGLEVEVYSREPRTSRRVAILERTGARYFPAEEMEVSTLGAYDFIFEATGAPSLIAGGIRLLRPNGIMALLGVSSHLQPAPVPFGEINNRLVLNNQVVFGSVNANRQDFAQGVLDLVAIERQWPGLPATLFTRRVPFERFQEALARQADDIKVVVQM
jgi:threonine dehydrogenase-like Zn-dependent dehydrogenase